MTNSYSDRPLFWALGALWGSFFLLILLGWVYLYLTSPAYDGAATFGALDVTFSWAAHSPPTWQSIFLMWGAMALAMMVPTLVPMLSTLFGLTYGKPGCAGAIAGFIAGYVLVWLGFALIASTAQVALYQVGWVDALGLAIGPGLTLILLTFAGLYQFSKWKQACLRSCQAPMMFFMSNWRDGLRGAIEMGGLHGLICVGCCWALMALGFVGGAMNLIWMGIATLMMILEKMPGVGTYVSPVIGCILLGLSLAYGVHIFINEF